MNSKIKKLIEMISRLTDECFYGKIEISFKHGKIIKIKKEESIQLD